MTTTEIRVAAVLLVAALAIESTPALAQGPPAQGLSKPDAQAFQMYRQSLAMRHNARLCEQGAPGYSETFGGLHQQWTEKHRAEIARGESIFKNAKQDPRGPHGISRATIDRVEERLAELSKPPKTDGPPPPAAQTKAACDQLLGFLREA